MSKMISSHRRRRLRIITNADEQSFNLLEGGQSSFLTHPEQKTPATELDAICRDFFADCQGRFETTLQLERPGAAPIFVKMDRPQLMIGSDPACDVVLTDVAIRHHHCLLQWLDGHIFCCVIASRPSHSATRNSESSGCWLAESAISIGPYQLSIVGSIPVTVPDYSALDRLPELSTEYPRLGFQFQSVDREDNVWAVDRPITLVGRSSQCRLRLNHKSVSLVHACLVRTAKACWMVDMAGDGTTLVNERAIRVSRIDVGDRIRIGSFQIEVTAMKTPTIEEPSSIIKTTEQRQKSAADFPRDLPGIDRLQAWGNEASVDEQYDVADRREMDNPAVAMLGADQNSPFKAASIRIQPGIFASTECDSIIIQPPLIDSSNSTSSMTSIPLMAATKRQDSSIDEFTALQRTQLELLQNHLDTLKATFDKVAPTLISNRMRASLEKPVDETIECCKAMRQSLDRFTSPQAQGVS